MEQTINFGSTEETRVIDESGSTKTEQRVYQSGTLKMPIRTRYTIRVKVHNDKEQLEETVRFLDEVANKPSMLDAEVKIERTVQGNKNGFRFVVKCYTILSYDESGPIV